MKLRFASSPLLLHFHGNLEVVIYQPHACLQRTLAPRKNTMGVSKKTGRPKPYRASGHGLKAQLGR